MLAEHLPSFQGVELEWGVTVRAVKLNILRPAPLVSCSISEFVAVVAYVGLDPHHPCGRSP
eukprot:455622-Rhodomonas_salina.2